MLNLTDREWKQFLISDVFITTKKGKDKEQVPTGAYINKGNLKCGKSPRITVTSQNNGIDGFWETDDKNKREFSNIISVSFLGNAFYQKSKVTLDMKVHALIPKDVTLNRSVALFIVTMLLNNTKSSSYGNQLSSTDLPRKSIMLPINSDGTPDYAFMEQYIKEREQQLIQKYKDYIGDNAQMGGGYTDP